jgi:hypothetical protein
MARREWDDNDAPAPALHFGGADDRFLGVVTAFDNNVRLEVPDQVEWSVIRENDNEVYALERAKDVGALGVTAHGSGRTFEPSNGVIAVDPDNEGIRGLSGRPQYVDVP